MEELPDPIHAQIAALSDEGNALYDSDQEEEAISVWKRGLDLLPEPKGRWEAAMWLHASIGDAYRYLDKPSDALAHFQSAYSSGDGAVNPFVLLGLGATLHDTGQKEDATDPLLRAYMLEGEEIFEDEEKYLDYLRSKGLTD